MHRILLYALVVGLLFYAWDARRDVVLAGESRAAAPVPVQSSGEPLLARAGADSGEQFDPVPVLSVIPSEDRFEALVAPLYNDWIGIGAQTDSGPPAEAVLANAEHWMESNFPEGGRTSELTESETGELAQVSGLEPDQRGRARGEFSGRAGATSADENGADGKPDQPAPIYVASLARIEDVHGGMPGWYGLLDLALRPAAQSSGAGIESFGPGDTAWISDEQGKLLARVEALDGIGLEFDRTWPWSARQRRLFWTESGVIGMPVRQYRLVLEGNGFGPSWTGRLVLVHSRAQAPQSRR